MKGADNARDIHLDDISLQVPGKTLIKSASLSLAFGSRYGLVGRNGIGKSVLMKALAERDSNTVFGTIPKGITIMYVQQEVNGDDLTPLETVMNADKERTWLVAEEKRLIEEEERREREDKERDEVFSFRQDFLLLFKITFFVYILSYFYFILCLFACLFRNVLKPLKKPKKLQDKKQLPKVKILLKLRKPFHMKSECVMSKRTKKRTSVATPR